MLISQLLSLQLKRFTGQLNINLLTGTTWKLYFCCGQIVWADGGCHPYRSWKRLLIQYCPQVTFDSAIISKAEKFKCWNYRLLAILLERKQINSKQFTSIVNSKIVEVFFDIIQVETNQKLTYNCLATSADYLLASGLKISLALFQVGQLVRQIQYLFIPTKEYQQKWSEYCQNNPDRCSPNLAPSLKDKKQLAQQVSPQLYQILIKLINGQRTIRDLAVMTNQDVLRFSCSLIPYIRQGLIELIEIADLQKITTTAKFVGISGLFSPYSNTAQPLIACVDDSKMACYALNKIITPKGYRFLSIHDSLKAIFTLLKTKPDLIFLDLLMPVINGYELCAQLRKTPSLKDVPIVILTGQDGLVDRVRAKLVGSTDFLSKPVDADKVISMLSKYLTTSQPKITYKKELKPVLTLSRI